MPDLSTNCGGIKSPNPFWLASAPPAPVGDPTSRVRESKSPKSMTVTIFVLRSG